MKLTTLLEGLALAAVVHAATFKTQIVSIKEDVSVIDAEERRAARREAGWRSPYSFNQKGRRRERYRRPVRKGPIGDVRHDEEYMEFIRESARKEMEQEEREWQDSLGIWNLNKLTYVTEIAIGNPPQPFNVLLSISSSDLIVPSISCGNGCGQHGYNSNLSSTSMSHNREFPEGFLRAQFSGILSEDAVHISGLSIPKQMFGEAKQMDKHRHVLGNDDWDGILGLAPSSRASPLGLLNPMQNMMRYNLLDRNIFSVKLPRGDDNPGEILFGAINHDMYVGELKTLPLVDDPLTYPRIKGRWTVDATGVSIGDTSASLKGYLASFETDFPYIGLPEDVVTLLYISLGMQPENRNEPPSIPCERRRELKNLTITLHGEDFVISPWEYTIEVDMDDVRGAGVENMRCVTAFIPMPNFIDEKYILLGSAFLKAFYGVFDFDEKTVSLGKATTQNIKQDEGEWQSELKRS